MELPTFQSNIGSVVDSNSEVAERTFAEVERRSVAAEYRFAEVGYRSVEVERTLAVEEQGQIAEGPRRFEAALATM